VEDMEQWMLDMEGQMASEDRGKDLISVNILIKKHAVPHADSSPTILPGPLLNILLDPALDWTCPRWLRQFSATFRTVSPHQPGTHMAQR
jgi:hypothetical protein